MRINDYLPKKKKTQMHICIGNHIIQKRSGGTLPVQGQANINTPDGVLISDMNIANGDFKIPNYGSN